MPRSRARVALLWLLVTLCVLLYGGDLVALLSRGEDHTGPIDLQRHDVIVVLPIYRTGMLSLMDHVVHDVTGDLTCSCPPLKTRCECKNRKGNPWLFNSGSTGHPCGHHAVMTALTSCPVDHWMVTAGGDTRTSRRYQLATMLRDPITRYISEWLDIRTGQWTYINEPRLWRVESPEKQKKETACLVGKRLRSLSLTDFINCKDNPANNRMTFALTNISHVGQGRPIQGAEDLASAKDTLREIPFFGLMSALADSQVLMYTQFGITVNNIMEAKPTKSDYVLRSLSPNTIHEIAKINSLDMALHKFAIRLFAERFKSEMGYEVTQMPIPPYYQDDARINSETRERFSDHLRVKDADVLKIEQVLTEDEMRADESEKKERNDNDDDDDEQLSVKDYAGGENNYGDEEEENVGDEEEMTDNDEEEEKGGGGGQEEENDGGEGQEEDNDDEEKEVTDGEEDSMYDKTSDRGDSIGDEDTDDVDEEGDVRKPPKITNNGDGGWGLKPGSKTIDDKQKIDLARLWSGRLRSNKNNDLENSDDPAWQFLKQVESLKSKQRLKRELPKGNPSVLSTKVKTKMANKATNAIPTNLIKKPSKVNAMPTHNLIENPPKLNINLLKPTAKKAKPKKVPQKNKSNAVRISD